VHDHPGVVTDFPLAVADYQVRGLAPPWPPRHDLGLYEVFWCLAVIPLFWWLGRTKRPRGFYFALLPLLYAPVRFGLDFLRATDAEGGDPRILFGLTPGHYGAMLLFTGGLFVMWRVMRRPRYDLPREVREAAVALGIPRWKVTVLVVWRAAIGGIITAVLLSTARIAGETAPLLFTAFSNNFLTFDVTEPMGNLPVVMFNFALSPYQNWQDLAWAASLLITATILTMSVVARLVVGRRG